jgi:very-short-patch-repair endonuclease
MILNELGFQTVLEMEFGPFRADIYVPELKCIFEYDGPFHSKKKDKKRDETILESFSVETIRIKGDKELKLKLVQAKIDSLFNQEDSNERSGAV